MMKKVLVSVILFYSFNLFAQTSESERIKIYQEKGKDIAYYHSEGLKAFNEGKYQVAIELWKKEIEIISSANACNNIAIAYSRLDSNEELIWRKKAIELDPNFAKAHYGLGCYYWTIGDYESAIKEYN
ncbi:MAG: hypothetical protein HY919_03565 [Elusimicrobia bacterium]|nr:hypothetical protein [Elusimicrobiota bacterium]